MSRSCLLALCLALAGCAAEPPAPPPQVQAASPAPPRPPLPFDAQLAALPVRPAGAAFATASQEHALVRRRPAHLPAARSGTASSTAAGEPLSARVLAVQAAYRRWCAGEARPGDGSLLAEAGGVRLPGTIACKPLEASTAAKLPRVLFPIREQTAVTPN